MLKGSAVVRAGRPAGDLPHESNKECRTRLVALLLNFMKQYYLAGQEHAIIAMLQDICLEGSCPRRLGQWGLLTPQETKHAIAAFKMWIEQGRVTMPAQYPSPTGGIDCYVTRQNKDGTLNLGHEPVCTELRSGASFFVKHRADPSHVKARLVEGWFVPPFEQLEPWGRTPGSSDTATSSEIVVARHSFNPIDYNDGHPYLTLEYGDELERITKEVDTGWTKGRLRKRASGKPCAPGALGYDWGWYPENYAAPRQA